MNFQVEGPLSLNDLKLRYVAWVLQSVGGRKKKAAAILGVSRKTVYRMEKELNSAQQN